MNTQVEELPGEECSFHQLTVLLAEDDSSFRTLLRWALERAGYKVVECSDGVCLLSSVAGDPEKKARRFDVVVSDVRLPGVTGIEALEYLHDLPQMPPVIIITAFGSEQTHLYARSLGATTVLDKPFDMDELLEAIDNALLGASQGN